MIMFVGEHVFMILILYHFYRGSMYFMSLLYEHFNIFHLNEYNNWFWLSKPYIKPYF